MNFPEAIFIFGVIWIVTLAFGLLVELVARRFMPQSAARFGGFYFVAGFILGRREMIFGQIVDAKSAANAAASVIALLALGWRAFAYRFRPQEDL